MHKCWSESLFEGKQYFMAFNSKNYVKFAGKDVLDYFSSSWTILFFNMYSACILLGLPILGFKIFEPKQPYNVQNFLYSIPAYNIFRPCSLKINDRRTVVESCFRQINFSMKSFKTFRLLKEPKMMIILRL